MGQGGRWKGQRSVGLSRYDPRSMTSYRSTDPSNPVDKSSASLAKPRVQKDTYGGRAQSSTSNAGTLVSSACGWWVDHQCWRGDSGPVVVVGVTPHQGAGERPAQGEGV